MSLELPPNLGRHIVNEQQFSLRLQLERNYQFSVDFDDDGFPDLTVDEPPPLGDGDGPNASRLLAAAVGNCLGASLVYCLRKARVDVTDLKVRVSGTMTRSDTGRWRIGSFRVALAPTIQQDVGRMRRCLEVFEDFCIVTQSVRQGIPVDVSVTPTSAAASLA